MSDVTNNFEDKIQDTYILARKRSIAFGIFTVSLNYKILNKIKKK